MTFLDLNDHRNYSLSDLKRDWITLINEEPYNHAPRFKSELLEILMATINGRNDLEITGPTSREISKYIIRLRTEVAN